MIHGVRQAQCSLCRAVSQNNEHREPFADGGLRKLKPIDHTQS